MANLDAQLNHLTRIREKIESDHGLSPFDRERFLAAADEAIAKIQEAFKTLERGAAING